MNPLQIFTIILPLIEKIPSIEGSIEALVSAVEAMFHSGSSPLEIVSTVANLVPAISSAVVANTPHATTAAASVATINPTATSAADALNMAQVTSGDAAVS